MPGHQNPENIIQLTESSLQHFLELPKHQYFRWSLTKSFPPLTLESTTKEIQQFIQFDCGRKDKDGEPLIKPGGRHAYFRAIRCFFNWAYSPASGLGFEPSKNPVTWVVAPAVPRRKMPAQNEEKVQVLLSLADDTVSSTRNKAIISTFIDTGGRLSEVVNIREADIDWDRHFIKAICKGDREAYMPMGPETEKLLKQWLTEYRPPDGGNIWGINKRGIEMVLKRLEKKAGFKCNAHTFRRGFACIQRRNKVDTLDIKTLGHWQSYRMVERYTEDIDFEDAQEHYIPPSGGNGDKSSQDKSSVRTELSTSANLDIIVKLAEELGAAKEKVRQLEQQPVATENEPIHNSEELAECITNLPGLIGNYSIAASNFLLHSMIYCFVGDVREHFKEIFKDYLMPIVLENLMGNSYSKDDNDQLKGMTEFIGTISTVLNRAVEAEEKKHYSLAITYRNLAGDYGSQPGDFEIDLDSLN